MPFVHIKVAGPTLSAPAVRELQVGTTALMAGILRKRADLTAVLVEKVPVVGWAIHGKPVRLAAHLHATITAGTNTAEEKARFIAEAAALLRRIFGEVPDSPPEGLPTATYVVIDEVPAASWGYDGLTQERRLQGATLAI